MKRAILFVCLLLLALPAAVRAQNQPATAMFSVAGWTSPEGLPLTYAWSCTPACLTIVDGDTEIATITVDTAGTYDICATISDGVVPVQRCLSVLARLHMPPAGPDPTGPSEMILLPLSASISGPAVVLQAMCTDNVGCESVQFKIDGDPVGLPVTNQLSDIFGFSLDSTLHPDGLHCLSALGCDEAGNCQNAECVTVDIQNGV